MGGARRPAPHSCGPIDGRRLGVRRPAVGAPPDSRVQPASRFDPPCHARPVRSRPTRPDRVQYALVTPALSDITALKARIDAASGWYYRLILLHTPRTGSDGPDTQALAAELAVPYVNVSLALSEALLPYSRAERGARVGLELEALVSPEPDAPCVLVDKIEVLFQPDLRVAVLSRLRQLSRNRTLIVAWPGEWSGGTLTYASREHPEHFEERNVEPLSVFSSIP